ncbi:unnamed protein product [Lactuca saligna]|uniref:Uncharacterized protein n=1 Tax=Lactuca saligna TaxID=75948 RepID=A0AA36A3F4_LACSI|nr:unnamed protein product [Lactuca saligna]
MMHGVQVRNFNEREAIICNKFGQPIGPVTKEKDIVGQFSRFLGTIARTYSYAPLTYKEWRKVPHKEKMWEFVLKRCLIAKDVRMSQKNMHTAGPKSFARIHEEMMNDDPNKEPPTLAQMFERTPRRIVGNKYVDTYDDTANKIEQMKNYKPSEDGSAPLDPFLATMGKEYDGHRRLFRRGVTNRLMNKVNGDGTSYMVPRELMDSLRANAEKDQLLDMRKELDEDHARKMDELEEDHARKKAELEAMRNDIDKVVEDAMQRLIEKLPAGVAREFLT